LSGRKYGAALPGVPWQAGVRRLLVMARGGTVVAGSAVGAIAGLGYYLLITGKLTLDTGWAAGSARSARSVSRSPPPPAPCST
jgi:hypothetical protein